MVLSGLGAIAVTEKEKGNLVSEKILFSKPTIIENENDIEIELSEATSSSFESSKPVLPIVTKVYTFPFGTKIDIVDVTFSEPISQKITKPIEQSPEPQMLSLTVKKEQNAVTSYSDIDVYPSSKFNYKAAAGLSGEEHVIYLAVSLHPVQYKPNENTIYYSDRAEIYVSYTPPASPVIFGDTYDLLIITPAEFESALQPLVDLKISDGIRTKMVSLDEIPNGGADRQESIKLYIRDAIENWGITYLLLVGSGLEGAEKFPVRYAYIPSGSYEVSFPSDLYYADVYNSLGGFSDWDFDNDGKYAEYPIDFLSVDVVPDVYLGKLPANTSAEVSSVVKKIINYEAHNKMTNKILQVGGDTFVGDHQGINEGEYANTKVMEVLPGYNPTRVWASGGDLTKANIANGFRSSVDFVDFSGHGSWASWATHAPNDESVWLPEKTLLSYYSGFLYVDFDLFFILNSKKLPVVFYNACSTSKYTESDTCLSWKTVNKASGGGIATFGASGIGYGSEGTGETDRLMGWMEVHTFQEIFNNKILGLAWNNCILNYYLNFIFFAEDVDYKTMLEYSMFADPTLQIQNGDDPVSRPVVQPFLYNILERILNNFPILEKILKQI